MYADSLTLNYAGTGDLVLTKRKESNYTSEYFGTIGLEDFTLHIKHTIPPSRLGGEHSHMVRMDIVTYDATNTVVAKSSVWRVFGSYLGQQNATRVTNADKAIVSFLTAPNMAKLLAGES